jgi:hypothetical protein
VSPQLETETHTLISVISSLQRAGRTGMLMVSWDSEMKTEEGVITFLKGEVTNLETDRYKGEEAFKAMCQWRTCSFFFIEQDQLENVLLSSEKSDPPLATSIPPSSSPLRNLPVLSLTQKKLLPSGQTQKLAQFVEQTHRISLLSEQTQKLPQVTAQTQKLNQPVEPAQQLPQSSFAPSTLSSYEIPAHLPHFEAIIALLNRMGPVYRQVYILIDGQRSIPELMRLTGRTPAEIDKILHDLVEARLIRIQ